jgi:hypothetical protein
MKRIPEDRLRLWRALSSLFLDTKPDDHTFGYIAHVIREDGYTSEEAEHVLWQEVYPVLEANLRSVAGVWSGWPDEWLIMHISVSPSPPERTAIRGEPGIIREISSCWDRVRAHLEADPAQ